MSSVVYAVNDGKSSKRWDLFKLVAKKPKSGPPLSAKVSEQVNVKYNALNDFTKQTFSNPFGGKTMLGVSGDFESPQSCVIVTGLKTCNAFIVACGTGKRLDSFVACHLGGADNKDNLPLLKTSKEPDLKTIRDTIRKKVGEWGQGKTLYVLCAAGPNSKTKDKDAMDKELTDALLGLFQPHHRVVFWQASSLGVSQNGGLVVN